MVMKFPRFLVKKLGTLRKPIETVRFLLAIRRGNVRFSQLDASATHFFENCTDCTLLVGDTNNFTSTVLGSNSYVLHRLEPRPLELRLERPLFKLKNGFKSPTFILWFDVVPRNCYDVLIQKKKSHFDY